MTESIVIVAQPEDEKTAITVPGGSALQDTPSNAVYARVGDLVLSAAEDGVRRGQKSEDIIREIITKHNVHLSRADFRLLLASHRASQ